MRWTLAALPMLTPSLHQGRLGLTGFTRLEAVGVENHRVVTDGLEGNAQLRSWPVLWCWSNTGSGRTSCYNRLICIGAKNHAHRGRTLMIDREAGQAGEAVLPGSLC